MQQPRKIAATGTISLEHVLTDSRCEQDKLEDEPGNTVVLRKNYGMDIELKRPDSQAEARTELASYRAMFSCGRAPENMRDHLNLKQYMRWIALMDILRCGDYVDEVFFYNRHPPRPDDTSSNGPAPAADTGAPLFWDIHPWDFDDMFKDCHSSDCNEGVMDCAGHAHPLFYCAQSPLDRCLHEDAALYEQYKATVRELLQVITPPAYRKLVLMVASQMQRYFSTNEPVSQAMVGVDHHRDPWATAVSNIAEQAARWRDAIVPAAQFTVTGSIYPPSGGGNSLPPPPPLTCNGLEGQVCSGNACKRYVTGMTGRSCAEYCCDFGLGCAGAWEEQDNNCVQEETWTCRQTTKNTGGTTSDTICLCDTSSAPPAGCAARSPASTAPAVSSVAGDVWTSSDSPILAHQTVDIMSTALLGVEPGARALMANGAGVVVHESAGLIAPGRREASIELAVMPSSAECGDWEGLTVLPGSRGVLLRHVWLTGARVGLTLAAPSGGSTAAGGPVVIDHSAFDDWSEWAVVYNGEFALSIYRTTFGLSSSFPRDGGPAPEAIRTEGQSTSAFVVESCVFARQSSGVSTLAAAGVTIRATRFWDEELLTCGNAVMSAPTATLVINEVVASQTRVVTDRRGDFEDYIELFNPLSTELSLTGFTVRPAKLTLRFHIHLYMTITYRVIGIGGGRQPLRRRARRAARFLSTARSDYRRAWLPANFC